MAELLIDDRLLTEELLELDTDHSDELELVAALETLLLALDTDRSDELDIRLLASLEASALLEDTGNTIIIDELELLPRLLAAELFAIALAALLVSAASDEIAVLSDEREELLSVGRPVTLDTLAWLITLLLVEGIGAGAGPSPPPPPQAPREAEKTNTLHARRDNPFMIFIRNLLFFYYYCC